MTTDASRTLLCFCHTSLPTSDAILRHARIGIYDGLRSSMHATAVPRKAPVQHRHSCAILGLYEWHQIAGRNVISRGKFELVYDFEMPDDAIAVLV